MERLSYTIKNLLLLFTLFGILTSCTATRKAAMNERQSLSKKIGIEITKKDNITLYKQVNTWLGVKYRLGGTTKKGVDCSGFVGAIYRDVYGKKLNRTAEDIYSENCRKIRKGRLKEGDLVFFRTDGKRKKKPNHVGVYLKNGKFVHASTSKGVEVNSLDFEYYKKAFMKGGRVK